MGPTLPEGRGSAFAAVEKNSGRYAREAKTRTIAPEFPTPLPGRTCTIFAWPPSPEAGTKTRTNVKRRKALRRKDLRRGTDEKYQYMLTRVKICGIMTSRKEARSQESGVRSERQEIGFLYRKIVNRKMIIDEKEEKATDETRIEHRPSVFHPRFIRGCRAPSRVPSPCALPRRARQLPILPRQVDPKPLA